MSAVAPTDKLIYRSPTGTTAAHGREMLKLITI